MVLVALFRFWVQFYVGANFGLGLNIPGFERAWAGDNVRNQDNG